MGCSTTAINGLGEPPKIVACGARIFPIRQIAKMADQIAVKMKTAATIIIILIAGSIAVVWLGGRYINERHTIGNYTYALPADISSTVPGDVVIYGMNLALQHCDLNPDDWFVSPLSRWQPTNEVSFQDVTSGARITLTNHLDQRTLYVRIEPTRKPSAVSFHLYSPK